MIDAVRASPAAGVEDPWAPLRAPIFRRLWLAQVVSNLGTWMQMVGAQWVIVSSSGSAALVSLVQTASTAPVVLLAAPAGVLADVLDRRRVLVTVQVLMVGVAATLAGLTFAGVDDPAVILAFTFLLGCGAAFVAPAWQAIQPELVPRPQIPQASALGAVNMNLARAVGPAIGGLLVASAGTGWVFALNAASFAVVAAAVASWRRQSSVDPVGRERMVAALRSGARYVRHAPAMRRILVRSLLFVPAASALWALLPAVASGPLGLGADGYGVLLGALGAGALAGALVLPAVRARLGADTLLTGAAVGYTLALLGLAGAGSVGAAVPCLLLAGATWMAVLSSLNAAAQMVLPAWVRARALSYYLVVFMGGQAVGGVLWGAVAGSTDTRTALGAAAGTLGVLTAVGSRLRLRTAPDPTPSTHWGDLPTEGAPADSAGPVRVLITYDVLPGDEEEFVTAMEAVGRVKRRTGGRRWSLYRDTDTPARFVETFLVDTWGEHRRQHSARLTVSDRLADQRVQALLTRPPEVVHLLVTRTGRAAHRE